jgi:aminoglycoside phosphotransferase (APT) family kinase protein
VSAKLHADEWDIDAALVRRLLAAQFPQWAGLTLAPVESAGTDNVLHRLGDDMVVRLPRIPGATGQVEKEQRWLPELAPVLPLAIPVPLAEGKPGEGYPWRWSVYRWLEGDTATEGHVADPGQAARVLGQFVAAMQRIDPSGGPYPGASNSSRGVPLVTRDAETRGAIRALSGTYDAATLTAAWEAALAAPAWHGPPVWLHGDLHAANLLADRGRLSAVIDFGCLGVGDPACDVMVAWTYLSPDTREAFRSELEVDDATWARGRGWALSMGAIALPYYHRSNPVLAAIARRAIDQALADQER